jgi:hypothetical protein
VTKVIGTLVPPGGYLGIFLLGPAVALGTFTTVCRTVSDDTGRVISSTCPSGPAQAGIDVGIGLLVVFYLLAPIFSAAYLAVRLRHARSSSDTTSGDETIPTGGAGDRRHLVRAGLAWPRPLPLQGLIPMRGDGDVWSAMPKDEAPQMLSYLKSPLAA